MSKTSKRSSIRVPSVEEDKTILAAAKTDLNAKPLSARQLKKMVPLQAVRGRPKLAKKTSRT
jgi:hypothetical protein